MPCPTITDMESALLGALEELHVRQGGPARVIATLHDARRGSAHPEGIPSGSPAILIRPLGRRAPSPGAGQMGGWSRWGVRIVSAGGQADAACWRGRESAPDEGIWAIAGQIRALLSGWVASPGCGPFLWRGEESVEASLGNSAKIAGAAWEQTWECSLPGAGTILPIAALKDAGPAIDFGETEADQTAFDVGEIDAEEFPEGAPLFIALGSGNSNRCLGKIVSNHEGILTCERAPGQAYPAGSVLWSPASYHAWTVGRFPPLAQSLDAGTEFLRALSGEGLCVRQAAARRSTTLGIGPVARAEVEAFRAWLDANTRGGLDPFTWADELGNVACAWIAGSTWREEESDEGFATFSADLALGAEGSRSA